MPMKLGNILYYVGNALVKVVKTVRKVAKYIYQKNQLS